MRKLANIFMNFIDFIGDKIEQNKAISIILIIVFYLLYRLLK